jgi:glutathione S-transferase
VAELFLLIANKNYSSWSLRPWLALKHSGIAFEEALVPLDQPETQARIRKHSPSGRVPFLRHGAVEVWESLAICEYLAEAFPGVGLWPGDVAARAHARAVANEMHSGFAELRHNLPMDIRAYRPEKSRAAKVPGEIARIEGIWRDARQGHAGEGPFLFGRFSIADCMFAPIVTRFRTYGVKLEPVAQAYAETILGLPTMAEWAAAAKQEPWVIDYPVLDQP